jgi:hypothetical protein
MDNKIIDLSDYREKSNLKNLEEELLFEIQQLEDKGIDMRQKYVIFDTSGLSQKEFTKEDVIGSLSFCSNILLDMGNTTASCEINNIVTRLNNNYYNNKGE